MTKKGIFYGIVKGGKIVLDTPQLFSTWIKTLEGKRIEVEIQKEQDDITTQQYRYLYGCVYTPIAEETGYTVDEVDGVSKRLFLTQNKGTPKEYVKEKHRLSRSELAYYIDQCIMKAAEIGVVCLPPNKFKADYIK